MELHPTRRAALAAFMLAASAGAAYMMTPHIKLARENGGLNLETAIPKEFGAWRIEKNGHTSVINPQTEQLLKATYSQTLTRTYNNSKGQRVMLSIAYGEDQTDTGAEIHHPEICYPAQGFQLTGETLTSLQTPYGTLRLKRLSTRMGTTRYEPVTYWIVIGREIALSGLEKRLAELRHSIRGEIVDGVLFRVSTIDTNTQRAYDIQDNFVNDLLSSLQPEARPRLAGLR